MGAARMPRQCDLVASRFLEMKADKRLLQEIPKRDDRHHAEKHQRGHQQHVLGYGDCRMGVRLAAAQSKPHVDEGLHRTPCCQSTDRAEELEVLKGAGGQSLGCVEIAMIFFKQEFDGIRVRHGYSEGNGTLRAM
jgi:hypothetical protein